MKSLFIFVITVILFACNSEKQETVRSTAERVIYYTCPMDSHKYIHHREPGKCEECGMELVAGIVTNEEKMAFYGCPMLLHSHVRQDSAGQCNECGMTLMPMRLVK